MVCMALNGSNHTVQIDPETSTLSTIREYVEGVTKLQKNDYYVTVNSYTPIRENVTLHLYNVTVNSTLVVHVYLGFPGHLPEFMTVAHICT